MPITTAKAKLMKELILSLMLALCGTLANAQENFYEGPRRTFSSGTEETMLYSKRYSARCRVCLTGKYDDSKKNFTKFALFVAYSYNPSPGTKRRFDFFKEKIFETSLPVNGKKRFKMLATDTSPHEGKVHGEPENYNLLEKEGKFFAVKVIAKFNGKKDDGIDCSKALKVKMKIKLVDRDKVAE
mgnify:FL=1